jgi:hypothetical protein
VPKILETWTVYPHGPLVEIDGGILTVSGDIPMPLGNFPRRMTVVRLAANRTAIFSAIALPEPEMRRIGALGAPTFLIVPNPGHRLDSKIWKARYPGIRVLTRLPEPAPRWGRLCRLFRYGVSRPRIPRTARRYIKDPRALASQLREWATIADLKRIIVSHGEPITDDPADVLRRLAAELAR